MDDGNSGLILYAENGEQKKIPFQKEGKRGSLCGVMVEAVSGEFPYLEYNYYHKNLAHLAQEGKIEQPYVPEECSHNAHMYYIKVRDIQVRTRLIAYLREKGICSVFHYVPLHSAPAGQKFGRFSGEDVYTTKESERLLRLPMFYNLDMEDVKYITDTIASFDGF